MDGRGYWDALSVTGAGLPSSFAGPVNLLQRLLLTGVSSPANLVGANADVDVLGDGGVGRLTCNAGASLSGMTGGAEGRFAFLLNAGANDLTVTHDAASTAANRFLCPGSVDYVLAANAGVFSWYDNTSSRWRIVADTQSAGGAVSQITATPGALENDYAPVGWDTATDILLDPAAPSVITGFLARDAGTAISLHNVSTRPVVLQVGPASGSAAVNTFALPTSKQHIVILPGDSVDIWYDGTATAWQVGAYLRNDGCLRDWAIPRNSAVPVANGITWTSLGGTFTLVLPTNASYLTSIARESVNTAGGASNLAGFTTVGQLFLPASSGFGGFVCCYANMGVGNGSGDTGPTMYWGVGGTGSGGSTSCDNLTDSIGFGFAAGDANLHVYHNDGAGVATGVDLGANFARASGGAFTGYLVSTGYVGNSTGVSDDIYYVAWRSDDLSLTPVVGTINTDIPSVAGQLRVYACNLAYVGAVSLYVASGWIWTPVP